MANCPYCNKKINSFQVLCKECTLAEKTFDNSIFLVEHNKRNRDILMELMGGFSLIAKNQATRRITSDEQKKRYKEAYLDILKKIIGCNYDKQKSLEIIEEKVQYLTELNTLEKKEKKRIVREKAEKEYCGEVKNRSRIALSEEEKEQIFSKFNHECVVCGAKEGLHIHHKDKESSNNQISNLVVLCAVCHKKVHMNVR